MRFKKLFFYTVFILLCFSCSLKQQHVLFENRGTTSADTATQKPARYFYRIKPDDIIQLRNLQDPKAFGNEATAQVSNQGPPAQTFQVDDDGNVSLPVIGHVAIAGLTRLEAQKKIEKLYSDGLLVNPIIELKILNLNVHIFGEVKAQGNYALTKETTSLIDILGQAGGLTNNANEKNIKIVRGTNQQEITVDLSDIKTLADPRLIMQDNDIVYIAQNKRAIRDEKLQNFSTLVQPSLLIFNTALIIYTLFR